MTVNPNHYTRWAIEPVQFSRANNLDFLRGNIVKYIMRFDAKDGLKDLDKAQQYLNWLREDYLESQLDKEEAPVTPWAHETTGGTAKAGPWRMEARYPVLSIGDADLIAAERALFENEVHEGPTTAP
jgi:hypothetical protein